LVNSKKKPGNALTEWRQLGIHPYVKIGIIAFLFYFLYHNEINGLVGRWITESSSWGHGFLIPFFSLYFVNQKKEQILNTPARPSMTGLVLLIVAIAFYPLNVVVFRYGTFDSLGMIAALGAVVLFLAGWKILKYTWLPVVYLVFAVPPPDRYYVRLTMPMRKLAAGVASALLDRVPELQASVNGVIINVIYKGEHIEPSLNVADACSGMKLLLAFLALGVAMAYLHYRPIWQRIILLVSTIPIAVFCNIVRVTATGFIHIFLAPKYSQGIYHDLLGLSMLPLAFGLYGVLAMFMSSLFVEENEEQQEDIIVVNKSKKNRTDNGAGNW